MGAKDALRHDHVGRYLHERAIPCDSQLAQEETKAPSRSQTVAEGPAPLREAPSLRDNFQFSA